MKRALLVILTLLVVGCSRGPESSPTSERATLPAPSPARSLIDGRDQYQLGEAIVAAARLPQDDQPGALARLRASYLGKRYRWELRFVPTLCRDAANCNLLPFDHAKADLGLGFLPRLEVDAERHRALLAACKDKNRCVVQIEARLANLTLDTESPTALELSDVRVMKARQARQGESWVRRSRAGFAKFAGLKHLKLVPPADLTRRDAEVIDAGGAGL